MNGPKPRDQEYLRGHGRSSNLQPSHNAASSNPAASGGSSTAEGLRHNDDDAHVPDNFAYSANTSKKSRDNASLLGDGNGRIGGATRTHAVADAAAAAAALGPRRTRRTGPVTSSSAAAAVDEATVDKARIKVDARESRVTSEVTEGPAIYSLGSSVGEMGPIGISQARNLGGASVCSAAAGGGRRAPLDGENGKCDADVATTRRRVGRKARRTYGR